MQPLNERFAARAQRKADNAAESTAPTDTGMGQVMVALAAAQAAIMSLSKEGREELSKSLGDNSFFDVEFIRSIAEDENGNLVMAGIGVINPNVTPPGVIVNEAKKGVQKAGELPSTSFDRSKGNVNGQAVQEATDAAGWGQPPADEQTGAGSGDAKTAA